MEIDINYWAVIVSAIASMVIGFMWYGPLFGKVWMKEMNFTKESMQEAKAKGMGKSYALMMVSAFVMSYVLAHSLIFASAYTETYGASAGFMVGFWSWLGFVAPVTLSSVLWDGKSWKLWFINTGYYLASLVIAGIILASWM